VNLLRQIFMFGLVGCCATLVHIGAAWSLMEFSSINKYLANLTGTVFAYLISFLGNALLTFGVRERLGYYALRYLFVSCCSLVLTSVELALVQQFGLSNDVYAVIVLLTVPPATFLVVKLWAFDKLENDVRASR